MDIYILDTTTSDDRRELTAFDTREKAIDHAAGMLGAEEAAVMREDLAADGGFFFNGRRSFEIHVAHVDGRLGSIAVLDWLSCTEDCIKVFRSFDEAFAFVKNEINERFEGLTREFINNEAAIARERLEAGKVYMLDSGDFDPARIQATEIEVR